MLKLRLRRPFLYRFFSSVNHYETLELPSGCTQKDIKIAYRRLAKIYHPDLYKGPDKDRFSHIQKAYETLKSPETRKTYDNNQFSDPQNDGQNQQQSQQKDEYSQFTQKNEKDNADLYSFTFDKKIFSEENIEKDFQKFMSKDMKTRPEKIIIQDDPVLKQYSKQERQRHDYTQFRSDPNELYKKAHQLRFEDASNEHIDAYNEEKKMDKPEEIEKFIRKENKKTKRMNKVIIGIFFFTLPFYYSLYRKKSVMRQHLDEDSKKLLEYYDREEIEEVQDRLIFEKKDHVM